MRAIRSTALINSAAYIGSELTAEFGALPPAFLPFGNGRLFLPQIEMLRPENDRIILTIPASFTPEAQDRTALDALGVELLAIPDGLSLGASVAYALTVARITGRLEMLHGDTLFLPSRPIGDFDTIGTWRASQGYDWGAAPASDGGETEQDNPNNQNVMTGWFKLNDAQEFNRALVRSRSDFMDALDIYGGEFPLSSTETPGWLDFGHLQTFYQSRASARTARSFNDIEMVDGTIVKSGDQPEKLSAEAAWFTELPSRLRLFTPPFLGKEEVGYRLGYQYSPTLHELFVFGKLEQPTWRLIMASVFRWFENARKYETMARSASGTLSALSGVKTRIRLHQWAEDADVSLTSPWKMNGRSLPSLTTILDRVIETSNDGPELLGVMHGDFCFTNLFFDFREGLIKAIDPRGGVDIASPTVMGDIRYDLAKFGHSVEGYDYILADRYDLNIDGQSIVFDLGNGGASDSLRSALKDFTIEGRSPLDVQSRALIVQLFLSMLPLHSDRPDRQKAFLANALRIYMELEKEL